jgi:class 3 adenylate cyclase
MGRDESGTLALLRKNRSEHLDPALTRYGGRLVKLTGDGALHSKPPSGVVPPPGARGAALVTFAVRAQSCVRRSNVARASTSTLRHSCCSHSVRHRALVELRVHCGARTRKYCAYLSDLRMSDPDTGLPGRQVLLRSIYALGDLGGVSAAHLPSCL